MRVSSWSLIASQGERAFHKGMHQRLAPEDRLDILRAADPLRKWSSLDARRICTRCNKFIAGRQIEIRRDHRGRFLLRCPTPNCPSTVEEWFYLGNGANQESAAATRKAEVSFLLSRLDSSGA